MSVQVRTPGPRELEGHILIQSRVTLYLERGHSGYILWFRQNHGGEDPPVRELAMLAQMAERQRPRGVIRLLRAIADALT